MWINWKRFTCGALLLASLALLLSGCGSLGGSSQTAQPPAAAKTLAGFVSDPQSGLPMANVAVTAYPIGANGVEGSTPLSYSPASATTTAQGRYTLHIPADYSGSVMVVADLNSGSVIRTMVHLLDATAPRYVKAAVPQGVVAASVIPPVMVSFATNTVVEFVAQHSSSTFSQDNIRTATAALETFFGPNFTQTPPPVSATDTNTSKAQQDLIVSIRALNSVMTSNSTTLATIVSTLNVAGSGSNGGLGTLADSIKTAIVQAAGALATQGTVPAEYQPSTVIIAAISNAQNAPVALPDLRDTVAPTAPQNLSATAQTPHQVALTWSASTDSGTGSTGVAGYQIWRADTSGVYGVIDTVQGGTLTYYDVSAADNTSYSYRIVAFDAARNFSEGSAAAPATTRAAVDTSPPSAPTGLLSRAVTTTEVALQWQLSSKTKADGTVVPAAAYNVYRNYQLIKTVSDTFFTDNSAAAGTAYTYFVKAVDADGNVSAASPVLNVRTAQPANNTQAPGFLTTTVAPAYNKVSLQWAASATTGATYNVYRDGVLIAGGITGTAYADVNVSPLSSYLYTVKAAVQAPDGGGVWESPASNAYPVTTPADPNNTVSTAPAVPKNLTATVGSASVALLWSAGDSAAAGYDIWRIDATGQQPKKIGTVTAPGFIDSTVTASTGSTAVSYVYLITAFSRAGVRSDAIAVGPVPIPVAPDLSDTTPPSAPANLQGAADAVSGAVSLSWTASTDNKGVVGYLVYRNGVQIAQVTTLSFTDSSTAPSATYSYSVKAFDNAGNFSGASNAAGVAIPAAQADKYTVSGRITLNGAGVGTALVTFAGASGSTSVVPDANGYFIVGGVSNGSYTLTVSASGMVFLPTGRTVTVNGARVTGQDFAATVPGAISGGTAYPDGTIVGGITYPNGTVIGGVTYPTSTVIGGVAYPTGTVIGGILFPNGIVIGGVSYPAGTVVGGIAFPVGSVTAGYTIPTGTVIGGVVYPTGTVSGGVIYPTGSVGGTVTFPSGIVGGTATYPSGVVVGGVVYPAGVATAAIAYPTGGVAGVILYPTGGLGGGLVYPGGVVSGGTIYPTGAVTAGTIFPTSGLTGSISYPGGSVGALLMWGTP